MASMEDVQFRCKLCQFTAMSKQQMADHFMDVHAAMEIVGMGSPPPEPLATEQQEEKEEGVAAGMVVQEEVPLEEEGGGEESSGVDKAESPALEEGSSSTDKTPSKKKPGFRSNAIRSTISHLVRAAEQASKDEWKNTEGTSRFPQTSSKTISSTVNAVGRELRKHKMKRKFEEFVLYGREQAKIRQARISSSKAGDGRKTSGQPAASKVPRKKPGKAATQLPKSDNDFNKKVTAELMQWSAKWSESHKSVMETCKSSRCGLQLPAAEMRLHMQCHMQSFYGFRCPHCKFMHSRWRKMRCHIYDDHNALEKPMLKCDWTDCTVSFTNLWRLKRHVLRDHIREKVTNMEEVEQQDPTKTGDNQNENQDDNQDENQDDNQDENQDVNQDENQDENQDHQKDSDPVTSVEQIEDVEYFVPKRRRRASRKKMEAVEDAEDTNGKVETLNTTQKRRKFGRATWLPSCSVCEAKHIPVEDMETHMALHTEEGSEGVKCAECSLLLDSDLSLKDHMKEFHKRLLKVYRCDRCKYAGDRLHDFRKHLITHEDTKPCMCEVCGKLMSTSYNLKVHLLRVHATDEQKTIHCAHCPYRCADNIVLKDHMRFQHNLLWNGDPYRDMEKLQTFKCDKCSYVGRKEKSLKYHMRVHTENRQFRCSICTYASKTKNNLILHMRTHPGLKPIKCGHCDYRGATNKVVEEHILSKHKGLRPFRCPCGWSTAYSGNMWKHMQEHRQRGDAFKDVASERYGGQKSKKKKQPEDRGDEELQEQQQSQQQQVVTIVHEFRPQDGAEAQLNVDGQQTTTQVITFSEASLSRKVVPDSTKYSQVAVLPIMGGEVQLNNLVQAVGMVATAPSDKDSEQAAAEQQRQSLQSQEDSQAANFLCKLAQAVTTGQAQKQASEAKEIPVECEVQASDGTVEQTIQDFILW